MPRFVPVTNPELARDEQDQDAELAKHRAWESKQYVQENRTGDNQMPAVGSMASIAFAKKVTGKQKMVRNEKGLWVKVEDVATDETLAPEAITKVGMTGGGRGLGSRDEFGQKIGSKGGGGVVSGGGGAVDRDRATDRDRERDKDRGRGGRERDRSRSRDRDREKDKDREKDREKDRQKDRRKERRRSESETGSDAPEDGQGILHTQTHTLIFTRHKRNVMDIFSQTQAGCLCLFLSVSAY